MNSSSRLGALGHTPQKPIKNFVQHRPSNLTNADRSTAMNSLHSAMPSPSLGTFKVGAFNYNNPTKGPQTKILQPPPFGVGYQQSGMGAARAAPAKKNTATNPKMSSYLNRRQANTKTN